jgi:AraC family transcriptional regulator
MPLVNFDAEIDMSNVVKTDDVMAFIGSTPCYTEEYTLCAVDHYMLGMPITPRPAGSWARYDVHKEKIAMGELLMFPPDIVQHGSLMPWTGVRKDVCCVFPKRRFEKLMGGPIDWDEANLRETINLRVVPLRTAMQRLAQEVMSPGMATSLVADSLARIIAVDVQRHFRRERVVEKPLNHILSKRELDKIDAFIHHHSADEIYLRDLASLCELSVRHFSRMFKATTGFTIANYVAVKRVEIAQNLLCNTKMPIKLVASKVGFSSATNFTTAFKRLSGVAPSSFRDHAA